MFKKATLGILLAIVVIKAEIVTLMLLALIGVIAVLKLFSEIVEHGNW